MNALGLQPEFAPVQETQKPTVPELPDTPKVPDVPKMSRMPAHGPVLTIGGSEPAAGIVAPGAGK